MERHSYVVEYIDSRDNSLRRIGQVTSKPEKLVDTLLFIAGTRGTCRMARIALIK